jgi:hypothetical protein
MFKGFKTNFTNFSRLPCRMEWRHGILSHWSQKYVIYRLLLFLMWITRDASFSMRLRIRVDILIGRSGSWSSPTKYSKPNFLKQSQVQYNKKFSISFCNIFDCCKSKLIYLSRFNIVAESSGTDIVLRLRLRQNYAVPDTQLSKSLKYFTIS